MEIFPFTLGLDSAEKLFTQFCQDNLQWLTDTYGRQCYVGRVLDGYERYYTWHTCSVIVTARNSVTITTFHNTEFGYRQVQEKFDYVYPDDKVAVLDQYIHAHKMEIAYSEYLQEIELEAKRKEDAAVDAMYVKLFGADAFLLSRMRNYP